MEKEKLIVEIGMKLDKPLHYYRKLLERHGLKQVFKCTTHDLYFTRLKSFDGLTENEIKNNCIRIRNPQKLDKIKQRKLLDNGYFKVFDTIKKDYHYQKDNMISRVQLQVIKKVGLVVYYDNPNYYSFSLDEQRRLLLEELNSYGFFFSGTELGIDKLRTIYYGKEMFSLNQNG